MIILKEQNTAQILTFIPREYSANAIVLRNETTNEEITYNTADSVYNLIDRVALDGGIFEAKTCLINTFDFTDVYFYKDSYYLKISILLSLKENTFYNLTIKNGTNIVYKDKIFCTNQVDNFSVNKNDYVANTTTNEYKIYE